MAPITFPVIRTGSCKAGVLYWRNMFLSRLFSFWDFDILGADLFKDFHSVLFSDVFSCYSNRMVSITNLSMRRAVSLQQSSYTRKILLNCFLFWVIICFSGLRLVKFFKFNTPRLDILTIPCSNTSSSPFSF